MHELSFARVNPRPLIVSNSANSLRFAVTFFALVFLTQISSACFAEDGANVFAPPVIAPNPYVPITWDSSARGAFITCLCADRGGRLWVGTEDYGVWEYDPGTQKWTDYNASSIKDTSVYSLACDFSGRVWVGTLNYGVAVWNGSEWASYGEPEGLTGEHVFSIAVSPYDGSVWMATEAGLTSYSTTTSRWTFHPTNVNGALVEPDCLAFARDGRLYVGTQCDGILIGSPKDGYRSWVTSSFLPGILPTQPIGAGLPSGMIDCILVASNGAVWAGTPAGLARSNDGGITWQYYCGSDWLSKQEELASATDASKQSALAAYTLNKCRMSQDFVTSLAEYPAGRLWVGHREAAVDMVDINSMQCQPGIPLNAGAQFTTALLPYDKSFVVGTYNGGLQTVFQDSTRGASLAPSTKIDMPSGGAPTLTLPATTAVSQSTLEDQLAELRTIPPSQDEYKPFVAPLPDDWVTQGNWLGRYGTYWAVLAATVSPSDYVWGAGSTNIDYLAELGPHCQDGDGLRYWVQWLYSGDPRVLEMPKTYLDSRIQRGLTTADMDRRESEWDDHGEGYDRTWDGPNVYVSVSVPAGLYRMSLYEFNKDCHFGPDNFRDYRISIRQHPDGVDLSDISSFNTMPELAHGRVNFFWGGVWKRFAVRGPIELTIEINRNYSFNTILPAVMFDLLDDAPPPYYQTFDRYQAAEQKREAEWSANAAKSTAKIANSVADLPTDHLGGRILENLDRIKYTNTKLWCLGKDQYYPAVLRWYLEQGTPDGEKDLAKSYAECSLYDNSEAALALAGVTTARHIESSLKWDGISNEGQGYQVVEAYMDSLSGVPAGISSQWAPRR